MALFLAYVLPWGLTMIGGFMALSTGSFTFEALLLLGGLISALIMPFGVARIGVQAWRGEYVATGDVFAYLHNGKLFGRALAVIGLMIALGIGGYILVTMLFIAAALGKASLLLLILAIAAMIMLIVILLYLQILYFGIAVLEKERLGVIFSRGFKAAVTKCHRIIGMQIALMWWIVLLGLLYQWAPIFEGMRTSLWGSLVYSVLSLIIWLSVGPYIWTANAGLAEELLVGGQSKEDAPISEPERPQTDWPEPEKFQGDADVEDPGNIPEDESSQ